MGALPKVTLTIPSVRVQGSFPISLSWILWIWTNEGDVEIEGVKKAVRQVSVVWTTFSSSVWVEDRTREKVMRQEKETEIRWLRKVFFSCFKVDKIVDWVVNICSPQTMCFSLCYYLFLLLECFSLTCKILHVHKGPSYMQYPSEILLLDFWNHIFLMVIT